MKIPGPLKLHDTGRYVYCCFYDNCPPNVPASSLHTNFCLLTLRSSAILLKATGREMALGFLGPSFNLGCFFGQLGIVRIASCQRMSVCVIVILRLLNYL